MTEPRLLSGADAAAYLGITPATFSKWVSDGTIPKPLSGTRRWDRKALDLALDKLSGIEAPAAVDEDDEDAEFARWKQGYDARRGIVTQNQGPREPWGDKFDAAWADWLVEHAAWNAEQPPSKRSTAADVEQARQALRKTWKMLESEKRRR
jgi:predicted DNA-binding transcriptional regulator AlpA